MSGPTDWDWTRARVVASFAAEMEHLDGLAERYRLASREEVTVIDANGTVISQVVR